jgi:8-oxo-dGTP diphosphatase
MRLIVVRHGIAKAKPAWSGPDLDRPLISKGERQAKAISACLSRYRPVRIVSSPSLRCRQTVEPLATTLRLPVEHAKGLATDAGSTAVGVIHQLVRSGLTSSTVVLCTHREVLAEALPALAREFGLTLPHRPPGAKGSWWILSFRNQKLRNIKYWRATG